MSTTPPIILTLQSAPGADLTDEEIEALRASLANELTDLVGPSDIRYYKPSVEHGLTLKTGAELAVGALVLAIAPVLVDNLLGFLRDWAQRQQDRKVKITIGLQGGNVALEFNPADLTDADVNRVRDFAYRLLKPQDDPY